MSFESNVDVEKNVSLQFLGVMELLRLHPPFLADSVLMSMLAFSLDVVG